MNSNEKVVIFLRSIFNATVALASMAFTLVTVFDLALFVYHPSPHRIAYPMWRSVPLRLLIDQALLSCFILQHSPMASEPVKRLLSSLQPFKVIQRSLYVLMSSAMLRLVMRYWQAVPDFVVWNYSENPRFFAGVHVLAWIFVYLGTIILDLTELLGLKQVYYDFMIDMDEHRDPLSNKSHAYRKFLSRVRHPSFLCFVCIFWIIPVMSLDKLLLAIVLTTYMYVAWKPDEQDYHYHRMQYVRKIHELDYTRARQARN